MQQKQPFSLRKRVQSFAFAIAGVVALLRSEHNAWIHLLASIFVLGLAGMLEVSALEWALLLFAMALVWVSEALNTALEYLADALSDDYNENIKYAKDIAAGAVLLAALFAVLIAGLVFSPYLSRL